MANSWFRFKQFIIHQDRCAMKVTTDACLFGAWVAADLETRQVTDGRLLDVGTGTGLLTSMIAQRVNLPIDAIELDMEAYAQAVENSSSSPYKERIQVLQGDVRQFEFPFRYDIIVSNPPFYEQELKSGDRRKNSAHHSEDLKLEELLDVIKKNLQPGGHFYLLLPYKRQEQVNQLFRDQDMSIEKLVLVRQSVQHDYFRIMIVGTTAVTPSQEISIDEIAIKDVDDAYTASFVTLLRDYYLNL